MYEDSGLIVLTDEEYAKYRFLLQAGITQILAPFRMYGFQHDIPEAIMEIMKLVEDWGLAIRGVDKPGSIEYVRRRK